MKLTVFDVCVAEGNARELAEFNALLLSYLKHISEYEDRKVIQKEMETLWNALQKGTTANSDKPEGR